MFFLELYEFEEDGVKSIYWNVNYPWPMSNRDVSFEIFELWGTALTWGRGVGGSDLPTSCTFYSWFPPP